MKNIFLLSVSVFIGSVLYGQTITPQVINSAGSHKEVGNTGITITDNVGEPFTETIGNGNFLITQGFIQPDVISSLGFTLMPTVQGLPCVDNPEGSFIKLAILAPTPNYSVTGYYWSPSTVCATGDCDTLKNIEAGTYSVEIPITYTTSGTAKMDTLRGTFVVEGSTNPCLIKVFSGVTPNGDGVNDVFYIENIREFPNNRVSIYNRWGKLMFETNGYNDLDVTKSWPNAQQREDLVPSTYFYIIELGNGSKPLKGWVEIIKD